MQTAPSPYKTAPHPSLSPGGSREIQGRCLIFVVAGIELLTDGFRIPGIALEILTGRETYVGTTGWSMSAIKFWLSVLKTLTLPVAAILCLFPRRIAWIGAGLALFTFLAWWVAAAYEEFDDLRHYADPDPLRAILGSFRLFSPAAPLLISAYILLRETPLRRRAAWLWATALALCTALTLSLMLPALFAVGTTAYAPRGATFYITAYAVALVITALTAGLKVIRMHPDPEPSP